MQIDGGTSSGIRVGDQLLIIDRDTIPQRSMEPGALAELSLVQVTQTFENHATVELVAGASLQKTEWSYGITVLVGIDYVANRKCSFDVCDIFCQCLRYVG